MGLNDTLVVIPPHISHIIDTAHIVSISRIFTSIQYNGEIDQVSAVSTYFS
jgi:hypothetical protein